MTTARASAPPPGSGGWYWAAELSCLGLGLALALSTTRLFSSGEPTTTLALLAVVAWGLAVALRSSPAPQLVGDLSHLVVGALLALWVLAPDARFGPLPTPGSVPVLAEVVRSDFSRFNEDIAPMAARPGHLVVIAALIWVLALFCSTTAMRLRAPVQAALPHVVAIVGLGFVARDESRVVASVLLLTALGFYLLAQGSWRSAAYRWQPPQGSGTARNLLGATAMLAMAFVVTAALVPFSPVEPDPVLDLRRGGLGDGGGPRTVVSPFVEVGSNLGPRSNDLLFSASTGTPGYWRLTSLEDYDADAGVWALANTYERVDGGDLAQVEPGPGPPADSDVSIAGLGGIWVPTPADPVFVDSAVELNWDPDSGSLVSRSGDIGSGDEFDFVSQPAEISPALLETAPVATSDPGLLDTSGTPAQLANDAQDLTAGLGPYGSALALQDFFRSGFTYDETVDYSSAEDPLEAFLEQRSGFCQQFSTAFALAARSIGLPSRVVVGFTTGSPAEEAGSYDIYGRNAHAWPEVHFAGIGWVQFEPTPGRGNPATSNITGVPPAQADPPSGANTDPGATVPEDPTNTAPADAGGADPDAGAGPTEVTSSDTEEQTESGGSNRSLLALVAIGLVMAIGALVMLANRRIRPGRSPDGKVSGAWLEACSLVAGAGIEPREQETPVEFAERVREATGITLMRPLAEIETVRRWSPRGADPQDTAEARVIVEQLREIDLEEPVPVGN